MCGRRLDIIQPTLYLVATLLNLIVQLVCSDDSPEGSSNNFAHSVLTERRHILTTGSNIYSRRPEKIKYILIMHHYGPQEPNKCNGCGINVNFFKEGFIAFDEFVRFCTDEGMFPWL
jgi:hypothetical protein